MPENGMTPAPGAPPSGGASAAGGAPPPQGGQASGPGGGPTSPVANRGFEAAAVAKLTVVAQAMQRVLAEMPAASEMSVAVRKALNDLSKYIAPGQVSQGVAMTEAQKNLMQQKQMGPQIAAARAAQMGGAPPQQPAPPQPQAA